MKKWLVAALLILALLVLVAPGIVGRLAEQNIEDNIDWAESDSPGVNIQTERFERGWFTSEGTHRVVLEGGQFAEASAEYRQATGNAELPSLIIHTELAHGPLPGGSLTSVREGESLGETRVVAIRSYEVDFLITSFGISRQETLRVKRNKESEG